MSCRSCSVALVLLLGLSTWGCGKSDEKISTDPSTSDDDSSADDSSPSFTDDDSATADDDSSSGGSMADDDSAPSEPPSDDDTTPSADDDVSGPVNPTDDDGTIPEPTADDDLALVPAGDDDAAPGDDDVATPTPSGLGVVGATCESDGDCMSGLTCLDETQQYFGGVYPHGLCTASCTDDPFLCSAVGGECIGSDTEAWCLPLCQIGGTGVKCRADQSCVLVDPDNSVGFCDSMCRDDMDCPENLFCDASLGLCMDAPATGLEVGEPCTAADDCAGHLCLPPTPDGTSGVCTSFCNLSDGLEPCKTLRDTADPAVGACDPITGSVVSGVLLSAGDVGLCSATCDLDGNDCEPGWTCAELTPEYAGPLGHDGICLFDSVLNSADAGAP